MNVILFSTVDDANIEFDWSDVLPDGVTLSSVVHTPDAPLIKGGDTTNATSSLVRVSGAVHAGLYNVEGRALLSNGETIGRKFRVQGWSN